MRRLSVHIAVLVVALVSVGVQAEPIYRYHDPKTKRDVFVSHRDQIPAEYREQAQPVVADGVLVDSARKTGESSGTVVFGDRQPAGWWEAISQMVRQAMQSPSRIDWRRAFATAVDTDLVRRGTRPLSADDTQQGLNLMAKTGWLLAGAGSLALAGWIGLMVFAWVKDQRGWTLGLLLCQPLSLIFALKFAEVKSRWLRIIMALVQLAPYVALVAGGFWLHAWFTTVLRGRGLG
jgi:hypothetical protein